MEQDNSARIREQVIQQWWDYFPQPPFTEEQELEHELPCNPPIAFLRGYFTNWPDLPFPPGNEVERIWQDRRRGPVWAMEYGSKRTEQA